MRCGSARLSSTLLVMPGLVPGISLRDALCSPKRDGRDIDERSDVVLRTTMPGHDDLTSRRIWPQFLDHRLDERPIEHVVEIDRTLDQALLAVEGEIDGEAFSVDAPVGIHAGRRDR